MCFNSINRVYVITALSTWNRKVIYFIPPVCYMEKLCHFSAKRIRLRWIICYFQYRRDAIAATKRGIYSPASCLFGLEGRTLRRQRNLVVCECSLQLAFLCHSNSLSRLDIASILLCREPEILKRTRCKK